MSLEIFESLEQGSEAWRQSRCGVLTASVIGKLITPGGKVADNQTSRGLIREIVAERITGRPAEQIFSKDFERGHLDEPLAREVYEQHTGQTVEEVGFITREYFLQDGNTGQKQICTIGYSPDGLVSDNGLIEIKSRKPRLQVQYIMDGNIPHDHMAQMQTGMFVTGREWCEYISYSGGLHMPIKRVYKDSKWQDSIWEAFVAFESQAHDHMLNYLGATKGMPDTEYVDHYGDDLEIQI